MQIRRVTALIDAEGRDISGNRVYMMRGSTHFISEVDIEYYILRPTIFSVSAANVDVTSYTKDAQGVVTGFMLPDGTPKLFTDFSGVNLTTVQGAINASIAPIISVNTTQNTSIANLQAQFVALNEDHVAETATNKKFTSILQAQLNTLWANYNGAVAAISSVSSLAATEGSNLVHTVVLTSANGGTFAYSITNGTASNGDYTTPPTFSSGVTLSANTLTVPNGVSTFTVTVASIQDATVEGNETYTLTIGGISGVGTINNDDVVPTMTVSSVSSPTAAEGVNLVFTVALSGATQQVQTFAFTIGGTALSGIDYANPLAYNNGVTISGSNLSVPLGVSSFTATTLTSTDALAESDETLVLTIGGVTGTGTITNVAPSALTALTDIAAFELPYGMMTAGQKSASATSGGYPAFAVSRNNTDTVNYAIYSSATSNGTYTKIADNQPYTPSALLMGSVLYNHRALSVVDEKDFPASISANTIGLIADTAGQQEHVVLNGVSSYTVAGATSKNLENVGVACFDSVPIQVGQNDTARVYVVGASAYGIDPAIKTNGITTYYKIVPKDAGGGELSLAGIMPVSLAITSRASKPYPPRFVGFNDTPAVFFDFPPHVLDITTLYVGIKTSSKVDETNPSSFYNNSNLNESGVTYKVDVEGLGGGTAVRTLTVDLGTGYATYSAADRNTDVARLSTKYTVYAEKAGIRSKELVWEVLQTIPYNNPVQLLELSQSGGNILATVVFDFSAGALNDAASGTGPDTVAALIQLAGTALGNVNLNGITANNNGVILEKYDALDKFLLQAQENQGTIVLTIPFTGGVGNTLQVLAGKIDNSISASITIV